MLTFLLSAVSPRSHYITPMSRRGAEFGIQSAISGLCWPGCSLCSRVNGNTIRQGHVAKAVSEKFGLSQSEAESLCWELNSQSKFSKGKDLVPKL